MIDSLVRIRILILSVLLVAALFSHANSFEVDGQGAFAQSAIAPSLLTVAFLDVGQGDAIFIETPDGVQMLIDGGANSSVLRELPKYMPVLDKTIDVVLATHPDKDHIGGLVDVLERYQVDQVIRTENKNDTAVSRAFDLAVEEELSTVHFARVGQQLALGASTSLLILSPSTDTTYLESNTASIITQLRYGDVEFMFTGDAPLSIEEYLTSTYGEALESEVLKLGHHGSRTSTADSFLEIVNPSYGVVSAGKDNRYGHPHVEVVKRAEDRGVHVLSTAREGTLVFKSDGVTVWAK